MYLFVIIMIIFFFFFSLKISVHHPVFAARSIIGLWRKKKNGDVKSEARSAHRRSISPTIGYAPLLALMDVLDEVEGAGAQGGGLDDGEGD